MCSAMAFDFSPHFWHDEYHFPVNSMPVNRTAHRTCLLYRGKALLRDHNIWDSCKTECILVRRQNDSEVVTLMSNSRLNASFILARISFFREYLDRKEPFSMYSEIKGVTYILLVYDKCREKTPIIFAGVSL